MTKILHSIENAIKDLRQGKFVIVVDDEDRENEGDLICAASNITPAMVNFAITKAKGLMCVSMDQAKADTLALPAMTANNTDLKGTAFTISIDYKHRGCTTGISGYDRAVTLNSLVDPETTADSYTRPGHVFPLVAKDGGVLTRNGHTEASLDLAKLAGLGEAGVLIEIIKPNGEMARLPDLLAMSKQWNMKIISIADLIEYRKANPAFPTQDFEVKYANPTSDFEKTEPVQLPTKHGEFNMVVYKDLHTADEYTVIYKDTVPLKEEIDLKVRLHSSCITGDIFKSYRCDCGEQLEIALQRVQKEGNGMIIYLPQEGRGIGLFNKMKAYKLQQEGYDTLEANQMLGYEGDLRRYNFAAAILKDMSITRIQLMTNNPDKINQLKALGIIVSARTPVIAPINSHNKVYMATKEARMDHQF